MYEDAGLSGAKGRDQRPGLDALLKAVTRREVDLVAAWSVDRLGRSLTDLLGLLTELHAKGVDLYLHQQGLDTSTPSGRAMFQMMGVFAEFERAMIRERVMAGLARAGRKAPSSAGGGSRMPTRRRPRPSGRRWLPRRASGGSPVSLGWAWARCCASATRARKEPQGRSSRGGANGRQRCGLPLLRVPKGGKAVLGQSRLGFQIFLSNLFASTRCQPVGATH